MSIHPSTTISDRQQQQAQLEKHGFVILEDFIQPGRIEALQRRTAELVAQEGQSAGNEFKQEPETIRLANLADKGEVFLDVIAEKEVIELVACVLGPEYKLSSLNYRSALPFSGWVQPLHCDTGALPDAVGNSVCNVIWMLDDFTAENGATRLIPGSHQWGKLPQEVLTDPQAAHPEEVLITGRAGTLVVMNSHLWHGGTANRTAAERRAIHSFYCRRDKPQQQYQKKLLRAETQSQLRKELRWLLALDDPLNDELCQQATGMSGFMK